MGIILELNKIHNTDCTSGIKKLIEFGQKVDLAITSPPYFNAREYSQWETLDQYFGDMKGIFTETYKVLNNHKYFVLNVGDITGQVGKAKWSTKKIPLGAYFTVMLEEIGFQFVDNFIWDKGEPQSKRHLGNPQSPFYQYPVNCYEHILIFVKHELDKEKIPCPVCNELIVVSNSQTSIGVQSWECKNPVCPQKSVGGRGKRFSKRSIMMEDYKTDDNFIEKDFVNIWRRDITRLNPVIKINSKGENTLGHTAPFPETIPEMAIRYFSGVNDVVLDMFAGSGTTQKVAKELGRRWIGFEINEIYCELANKRVDESLDRSTMKLNKEEIMCQTNHL